jgi:hypothetical protein
MRMLETVGTVYIYRAYLNKGFQKLVCLEKKTSLFSHANNLIRDR